MKCCENEDPAMFEVYKRIEWHCTQIHEYSDEKFYEIFNRHDSLFDKMKKLISELTLVQPDKRMKLEKAEEKLKLIEKELKLIEFESQAESNNFDFLLLKKRFNCHLLALNKSNSELNFSAKCRLNSNMTLKTV